MHLALLRPEMFERLGEIGSMYASIPQTKSAMPRYPHSHHLRFRESRCESAVTPVPVNIPVNPRFHVKQKRLDRPVEPVETPLKFLWVPKGGLEPPCPCEHNALNVACLPISPLRLVGVYYCICCGLSSGFYGDF